MINELPALLRKLLGYPPSLPRTIFTDRGPGFYQASSGTIVAAYKEALAENGFKAFAGGEAKWQPPDLPDVLLHETAVAWVRGFFKKRPLKVKEKVSILSENFHTLYISMKFCFLFLNGVPRLRAKDRKIMTFG